MGLSPEHRRQCAAIADRWAPEVAALALEVPAALRWPDAGALSGVPTLHLDDLGAIPFLDNVVGVEGYQLRARVRAGAGDLFVATCEDMPVYERYCRDKLQLGDATFIPAAPLELPIRVAAAASQGQAFEELCRRARESGGLNIHPYMGNADVWRLAAAIATAASVPVHVLAPPPSVTWLANDKWLMHRIGDELAGLLGRHPCVPTIHASSAAAAAAALTTLARSHVQVALKMTRCASAMGNRVYRSDEIASWSEEQLEQAVESFLRDKQWRAGDDVLAVAWLDTPLSPSTQTWITAGGDVRIDGLYEQLLVGPERVFEGSVPAELTPGNDAWLRKVSELFGAVFGGLGYRGRCSFDFIICDGTPYLVEVNGRWGGTSTPMHLVDRLFPTGRPAYRARDIMAPGAAENPWSFERLLTALGDEVYDATSGRGTYILYNVGPLPGYGKFDVIAVGADEAAAAQALARLPMLLERG